MPWFRKNAQCRRVQSKLSEYIDNMLSTKDKGAVEQHIKKCESCYSELESLKMAVQLLRRMPQVPAPRSFALAGIEPKRVIAPVTASLRWLRPATVFATFVLVALLAGDFAGVFESRTDDVLLSTPSPIAESGAEFVAPTATPIPSPSLPPTAAATPTPSTEADILLPGKAMGLNPTPSPTATVLEATPAPTTMPTLAPTATPIPLAAAPLPTQELQREDTAAQLETYGTVADGTGWPLRQIEIGLGAVLAVLLGFMIYSYRQRRRRPARS